MGELKTIECCSVQLQLPCYWHGWIGSMYMWGSTCNFLISVSLVAKANYRSLQIDAIIVIALSHMSAFMTICLTKAWVIFEQGEQTLWICICDLVFSIGPENTQGIFFFHAFSGHDRVSGFNAKGNMIAWLTRGVYVKVSGTFSQLTALAEVTALDLGVLEQCVDQTSTSLIVNLVKFSICQKAKFLWVASLIQGTLKELLSEMNFEVNYVVLRISINSIHC